MDVNICTTAEQLIDYAAIRGLIDWSDRTWAFNALLEAVGTTDPGPDFEWVSASCADPAAKASADSFDLEGALNILADFAIASGAEEDTTSGRDRIAMRIMGILMPRPSEVVRTFDELTAKQDAHAATDWFYRICCDAGYVRRAAIARNIEWTTKTHWGALEITINLSKPEKDPREIAAQGAAPTGEKYPACQLCIENEGYPGRAASSGFGAHPARQNLRIIPIELGGERWGFQYSPYAYFNEHCIAMSSKHRPMHVDRQALSCLFDFVDLFPHYFIGSNADLPIVGGSILSHDHFQGGAHEFPMMCAKESESFTMDAYPEVKAAVLVWPMSVLRLQSQNRAQLLDAATYVINSWKNYSDESVHVIAQSADGTKHNTVTPIVRHVSGKSGNATTDAQGASATSGYYEVYLALRCNITSDEYPMGLFHPHAEYHHIKRENIGLIEVMGLAILPPRLVDELGSVKEQLVEAYTTGKDSAAVSAGLTSNPKSSSHAKWAEQVYESRPKDFCSLEKAEAALREEVGIVFSHVLENAGVFKWDEAGRAAQKTFCDSL